MLLPPNSGHEIISDGNFEVSHDGGLGIRTVGGGDRGRYTCTRANEAGTVEADAFLDILGMLLSTGLYIFIFVYMLLSSGT